MMAIQIQTNGGGDGVMLINRGNTGTITDTVTKTRNEVQYTLKPGYSRSRVVNR